MPAAEADADGDVAAAGVLAGAPDDEADAAGEDEAGELQAASKIAVPHAMTAIPTWRRRI